MKSPENGKENEQMKVEDIISHVDHTLLKAAASWEEIRKLCDEAVKYQTASVCVPSSYVNLCAVFLCKEDPGKLFPPYYLHGGRVSFGQREQRIKSRRNDSCP